MKKIHLILLMLLLFITSCLFFYPISLADADTEGMDFSMTIVPPKNQTSKDLTYFDFLVQPAEQQELNINIVNTGTETKTFLITPTNAITNPNGIVDYSKQMESYQFDKTLQIPFTSLVSEAQTVKVKPGETQMVSFNFQAPEKKFDGIILGGFVTSIVEDTKKETHEKNVTFVNKFQLIKAVVVRSSDKKVTPHIVASDIKPALYAYRTAVTVNLQNTTPMLLGDVSVSAEVTKKGSNKVIKSEKRENVEFAPNSNFDFPIMWDNERLVPGDYLLDMVIEVEDKVFKFNETFQITDSQSKFLNNKAVELKESKNYLPWIILFLIVFILILVLTFIIGKQYIKNKKLSRNIKRERNQHIKRFKNSIKKK